MGTNFGRKKITAFKKGKLAGMSLKGPQCVSNLWWFFLFRKKEHEYVRIKMQREKYFFARILLKIFECEMRSAVQCRIAMVVAGVESREIDIGWKENLSQIKFAEKRCTS